MAAIIVTGSGGLVGSEAVKKFHKEGFEVYGIDNDSRASYFGQSASTSATSQELERTLPKFRALSIDIRDNASLEQLFMRLGSNVAAVIHCAAQPSHDWAASNPRVDFEVNASSTLSLLEFTRKCSPQAVFIYMSTNKVYGDLPNAIAYEELPTRFEVTRDSGFYEFGINERLSIDQSTHSLFGVSKASGDLLVQEYGRYFGMNTVAFRGGCLTGPSHKGTVLHGFLSYLVACGVRKTPYEIYGYGGKQVRDNLHSEDLAAAFWEFFLAPRQGEVYNIGGSRYSNISILEARTKIEEILGNRMEVTFSETRRTGDHRWYVSDVRKFSEDYPRWKISKGIDEILLEMVDSEKLAASQ